MDDVHRCIEIHLKGCAWWIIVMRLMILLIMHYLIWKILMVAVLDVYARDVRLKSFLI